MTDTSTAYAGLPYYQEEDIFPVTRITAGALGGPGRRMFVLQVHFGGEPFSWVIEKAQAQALGRAIPRLLAEVRSEFPELGEPLIAAAPNLSLTEPLQPLFRVGSLSVTYDRMHDLVVLTLVDSELLEPQLDDEAADDEAGLQAEHQIYATRGQAFLLSEQVVRVIAAGRPLCPACDEPLDDFGHFCLPPAVRSRRGRDYLH